MWFGVPTPYMLVTNRVPLVGYGVAFGFGVLLHRQVGLLRAIKRRWALYLALSAGLIIAGLQIAGVSPELRPPSNLTNHLAGAAVFAAASWMATFAIIGMALRFVSGYSAVRRYVADASYWVYLIHFPIILTLQALIGRLSWPAPIKFSLILLACLPLMLMSYQLMVRYTLIGEILNGVRHPRLAAIRPEPAPTRNPAMDGVADASVTSR
jgi:peptidoglycan/LPS O-acetylase OafA/YrhL